jgi:hypothetical protein
MRKSAPNETRVVDRGSRRSWSVEARTLTRQTVMQGKATWIWGAGSALVLAASIYLGELDWFWFFLASVPMVLVAGASALGLENSARTYPFLAHHGARPGLVWLVKLSVWAIGAALIAGIAAGLATFDFHYRRQGGLAFVAMFPLFFAVALLCGMAFRRGITAVVIAMVFSLGLSLALGLLVELSLLPSPGVLVVAAALLAVSWAWTGDWMLDRAAPGRWLRLGLLLAGAFGLLFACYVGFRVWSVRDIGPIAPPAAWTDSALETLPADRNAAGLYVEAGRRLVERTDSEPLREAIGDLQSLRELNAEVLPLVRRAAALPDCRFGQPQKQTWLQHTDLPSARPLAGLVIFAAEDRLDHGDLAGAWNDIVVLFRIASHFSQGTGMRTAASSLEREALALAERWAISRGQTPERLHAALAAYRDLPEIASAADAVRAQANIVENTLNDPTDLLRALREEAGFRAGNQLLETWWIDAAAARWELARARRVNRLMAAAALRAAAREPGQRTGPVPFGLNDPEVDKALKMMPKLLFSVFPALESVINVDDGTAVRRRGLVQILALRAWQLRHGGQLPERLDALVPDELPKLPKDPYADGPFRYVRSKGPTPPPGSAVLYSLGPDRNDDGGTPPPIEARSRLDYPGDIVFAIPASEPGPDAGKERGPVRPEERRTPAAPR